MKTYNYFEAVKSDVLDYILSENIPVSSETVDEIADELNEILWCSDDVTGNASGSYTFNAWKAEENLCHNLGLLKEACEEFCTNVDILENPEACDVTIRCYLLSSAIAAALEEITAND